ncbi:Forkhead-associated (FHA) domain [Dillenia turbinata]|uniref:Forkhead-associated (FHA) domain n=1 Tax=Dillenia turbinata TaxID=194707 RepID=A0AAN8W3Q9_9MAGN
MCASVENKEEHLPHKPPPILQISKFELIDESTGNNTTNQEDDEVLVIGRHPDCNVVLGHPSISRFHLRIHSKPSLQKHCIFHLLSIHMTWVSGKKIEPEIKVGLNDGDTIKIGRVYRLHWIPTSSAYDFENPFGKSLPLSDADKEDHMNQSFKSEEILSLDSIMEDLDCSHFNENFDSLVKQPSPSAPLMPEQLDFCPGSVVSDTVNSSMSDQGFLSITSSIQFDEQSKIEGILNFPTDREDMENRGPMGKDHSHWSGSIVPESVNSSLTAGAILPRRENERFNENGSPKCLFETGLFERNENLEESPTPTLRSMLGLEEGLLCETAEEFRNGLMNPFSERFLWADGSPRGATRTCLDDVVLKEKFCDCPSKKTSKAGEGAKGLKLILLHNAQSKYTRIESRQLKYYGLPLNDIPLASNLKLNLSPSSRVNKKGEADEKDEFLSILNINWALTLSQKQPF